MIHLRTVELPPLGAVTAARTDRGLCLLGLGVPEAAAEYLRLRHATTRPLDADDAAFRQLAEFLEGKRRRFDLPLDLHGTPFQREVWDALVAIPYGETRSYAQVAAAIGRPRAVRAVGAANGANPVCIIVPCHRVIGGGGRLTGYAYGLDVKQRLLALEARFAGELPVVHQPVKR